MKKIIMLSLIMIVIVIISFAVVAVKKQYTVNVEINPEALNRLSASAISQGKSETELVTKILEDQINKDYRREMSDDLMRNTQRIIDNKNVVQIQQGISCLNGI